MSGLHYWVPFKSGGVLRATYGSHYSCFGSLPTVSAAVPSGSETLNYLYLSCEYTKEDFDKIYSALTRDVPVIHVNGKAYPAPKCEWFEAPEPSGYAIDKVRGYVYEEAPPHHMKVTFPEELSNDEVYAYIKFYCKLLSLPFCKKVAAGVQLNPVTALKLASDKLLEVTGKRNFLATYFAISMANQMIGYSFPCPMTGVHAKALKDYLQGNIRGWSSAPISKVRWVTSKKGPNVTLAVSSSYGLQQLHISVGKDDPFVPLYRFYEGNSHYPHTLRSNQPDLIEYCAELLGKWMKENDV
ncbi:hypothetical protein tf_17 [Pseudomonas phage tf]|jgi:hypothetical protein|uniref:Uncharacterized protein n=1 Tax=Pseudomonas phage tf TaxID=1114179 RepID=I2FLN8_9CAUD|nr:hypothetical protein tf_17 [Pseudomonas phage tf]CCE60772.1 hypothetical protein tf_17 [Pseudomonas phage tf]